MSDIYSDLRKKLDELGFGYTETKEGAEYSFLRRFFSIEDARYIIAFPNGYQTAEDMASIMNVDVAQAEKQLLDMSRRGLIFRIADRGEMKFRLVPVAHGVYEFQLKNVEADWSKDMSKHYLQGWGKQFYGADIPIFRSIPVRSELVNDSKVLPYDDIESILASRKRISVSDCICRKREEVRGKPCNHPMETCFQFNDLADYYIENDMGREIGFDDALKIVRDGEKQGLVVQVSNSRDVEAICICCSCACGLLGAIKYFPGPANQKVGNYLCEKDEELCLASCNQVCVRRCPVGAFKEGEHGSQYIQERCIGCGLCISTCPGKALSLIQKDERNRYAPNETLFETYDHIANYRMRKNLS